MSERKEEWKEWIVTDNDEEFYKRNNVPELIRCKDCKHFFNSNEKCQLIDTRLHFYETDKRWTGDSFCSWAERKGNNGN